MIQLKPIPDNPFICPECRSTQPVIQDVIIPSIHALADCKCKTCGLEFYQAYPAGHTMLNILSVRKTDGKLLMEEDKHPWLSDSFLRGYKSTSNTSVSIRKNIYRKCEEVIILNTLDSLYGHSLLKLYNAIYHIDHHRNYGLIVIIPAALEWLIPEGCAEAWVVDIPLGKLVHGYKDIQEFVSREFKRFNEIYLSSAYSHPCLSDSGITRLTGIKAFDLSAFAKQKPTVTFVLREDRFWFASKIDYWLYRIGRKMNRLSWANHLLALRQNKIVKKTIQHLQASLPDADFYIIGLGKKGSFGSMARDVRKEKVDASVEKIWCRIYSESHVVVGIHGSNMLLPTALSAGCVEILPEDRHGNIVQDLTVRYPNRLQLFLYRFAPQFAKPLAVSRAIESIIKNYEVFHQNMCINTYDHFENENIQFNKTVIGVTTTSRI